MIRRLSDYGLRGSYDFRTTSVLINGQFTNLYQIAASVHRVILDSIAPAIVELENSELINGFHFILRGPINLRISSEDWHKNEVQIRKILKKHNLSSTLRPWSLDQEHHGGSVGVILCYNNLEFNSRLILALLDAEKADEVPVKSNPKYLGYNRLVCNQWVHYLYVQYGLVNEAQIELEFNDSLVWLREIVSRDPGKMDLANDMLDWMSNRVTETKNGLAIKQTK